MHAVRESPRVPDPTPSRTEVRRDPKDMILRRRVRRATGPACPQVRSRSYGVVLEPADSPVTSSKAAWKSDIVVSIPGPDSAAV